VKGNFIISNFYSQGRLAARFREAGGGAGERGRVRRLMVCDLVSKVQNSDRRGLPMSLGSPTCAVRAGPEGTCRDERVWMKFNSPRCLQGAHVPRLVESNLSL
jgi:hypothetical protein